jgi:hypothetical protein
MGCYLCLAEQLKLNAAGTCVECFQGACAKPSSRRDHVFHGDRCACGCRKFVCEADMDEHSRHVHNGSVPTCFPALAVQGSTRALSTALQLPNAPDSATRNDAIQTLNHFLNYVMPGQTLLWANRNDLPKQYWSSEPLPGRPSRQGVFFYDSFYQGMTDRVAALALRTLGDSLRITDLSPVSKKLNSSMRNLVALIADQHGTTTRSARHTFDSQLEADTIVDQLHQWLPLEEEALQSLPQIPPTLEDKAIVLWLFEPDLASSPSATV